MTPQPPQHGDGSWRGPGKLRLILASDGEPIPEEDWPRVFEPYVRVPRRAALAYGVGLALARSIIDLHGGRVQVVGGPGATLCGRAQVSGLIAE